MTDMVERVAMAMWHDFVMIHGFPSPYPTWGEMANSDQNKRDVRSNARAAIEAMREPTEAMKDATRDLPPSRYDTIGNEYRDMIEAALSESQP